MKSRHIHNKESNLVSGEKTQVTETKNTLESQLIGTLGFTNHFLELASSEYSSFLVEDKMDILQLSVEKAKLEAKLTLINTKLDHLISVARIKGQREREKEWRDEIARIKAIALEKEIHNHRESQGKKLTGVDRAMYKRDGLLPDERKNEMMEIFKKFLESQKG